MDIIEKARELGRLIQEEDSYKKFRTVYQPQPPHVAQLPEHDDWL